MGSRKKHIIGRLQLRIIAVVFLVVAALQVGATFTISSLTTQDLRTKHVDDMDIVLDSLRLTLSSDTIGPEEKKSLNPTCAMLRSQLNVAVKTYNEVYPKYESRTSEMTDGSILLKSYLLEYETKRQENQGMGMSIYGDVQSSLQNTFFNTVSTNSCHYMYVGFVDAENDNFVVACGAYDYRHYPQETPANNTVASGYFFRWSNYKNQIKSQGELFQAGFIDYEYQHPSKGKIYVSARNLAITVVPQGSYWVMLEMDASYFTDQTRLFSTSFMITSIITAVVLVLALGLALYFLFGRRLRLLTATSEKAVSQLKQGQFSPLFTPSQKKHPDEIHSLNDGIAYFEGELLNYEKERESVIKQKERSKAELAFSAQIQHASLPDKPIEDGVIATYPCIQLAKGVGGDLYDYFYIDDHRFLFLIGDVSGKGVPAALFMMQAITKIEAKLRNEKDFHLGKEIKAINNEICSRNPLSLFITFFIGLVDTKKGTLSYVNCGHEEAFYRHNGVYAMLKGPSNLPLGVMEDFDFEMETIHLSPFDSLFLYTDGVSEAENVEGKFFGKARIGEMLNSMPHLPGGLLIDKALETVTDFQKGKEQSDDICMLSVAFYTTKRLVFDNKVDELDKAQDFISEALAEVDNPEAVTNIHLAMDEILANVIFYAYPGKEGKIVFGWSYGIGSRTIRGAVVDSGIPFNPLEKEANQNIAEVPGGLGILIAKTMLDELAYHREGDFNVLLFEKKF